VIVPVASLDRASMRALAYAASLQQPVLALHLSPTEEEAKRFRDYWRLWGDHLPLVVVVSPYRAIVAPMVSYIERLHWQRPDLAVTVILPEIVVRHWGGTASCTVRPRHDCGMYSDLCRRSSSRPSRSTCPAKRHSTVVLQKIEGSLTRETLHNRMGLWVLRGVSSQCPYKAATATED
jgi:hypothetical protein